MESLRETGQVGLSAKRAKISKRQVYRCIDEDKEFSDKVEEATRLGIATLEDHAIKRALAGSDVLTMFLLNGNVPKKYKRKAEGNESAGIHINISKEESEL